MNCKYCGKTISGKRSTKQKCDSRECFREHRRQYERQYYQVTQLRLMRAQN